ncbi:MAG: hypothetical protein ABIH41_04780 [Nanoarchaeota archaeon]
MKKQAPDKSRAASLRKETKKTEESLKEIVESVGITQNNPSTIVKIVYDIIMETIRASMLEQGYSSAGRGAHEAEVAFMRDLGFSENHVQFCDQLRYFRNGIMYYGKTCDGEYARKVIEFLERFKRNLTKAR